MPLVLSRLCLKEVIDEFERHYLSYSSSSDPNILQEFVFLQRKYSFDILSRLETRDRMDEKYVDLLVNKYLTVLYTRWFKNSSFDVLAAKVKEIGSNIEKIHFDCKPEFPINQVRDLFCYLPNLKILNFRDICEDKVLESVAKFCPNIEEIDVSGSFVTPDGLKHLTRKENGTPFCSKLKKISILFDKYKSFSQFYRVGVEHLLKNLPSLEYIGYEELPSLLYSMHKSNLSELDKVEPYNLISLNLIICEYSQNFMDIMRVCLSVCPRLTDLSCPLFNEEQLKLFSKLNELEYLHIKGRYSSVNVKELLKLKGGKLSSLIVENARASVSDIAESCPCLKDLCLKSNVTLLCDYELEPVFPSLECCTFERVYMDEKAVSLLLSSSPKLESISFLSCDLSSREIKAHILKCCKSHTIRTIILNESKVGMKFLKDVLLNCCSLESLHLRGNTFLRYKDELSRFAGIVPSNPDVNIESNDIDYEYEYACQEDEFEGWDGQEYEFQFFEGYNYNHTDFFTLEN